MQCLTLRKWWISIAFFTWNFDRWDSYEKLLIIRQIYWYTQCSNIFIEIVGWYLMLLFCIMSEHISFYSIFS